LVSPVVTIAGGTSGPVAAGWLVAAAASLT
jgi:hypothetical protein